MSAHPRMIDATAPILADSLPAWLDSRHGSVSRGIRWHFEDVADLAAFPLHPHGWYNHRAADPNWMGATFDGARRMARDGWQEGARTAARLRDGLTPEAPQAPRVRRFDVAGQVPDVRRALAGNPMAMRRTQVDDSKRRPVVSMLMSAGVNAMTSCAEMGANVAAAAAVIDAMESAGYRCDVLSVARFGKSNGFGTECAVRVKPPEAPVNLATLAFALGHTAMLRALIFPLAFADERARDISTTHGSRVTIPGDADRQIFAIPSAAETGTGTDERAAFRAIVRALRNQGCPGIPDAT
jgi:hypothetical protein